MPAPNLGRLLEAFDTLYDDLVDPTEPYHDADGMRWNAVGGDLASTTAVPFRDPRQLAEIRGQCRALAVTNEFAINGHENRISYIVGTGHAYRAKPRRRTEVPDRLVDDVQDLLDDFVRINHWHQRQQEIVRRRDRDGEAFLRLFVASDGMTHVQQFPLADTTTPA